MHGYEIKHIIEEHMGDWTDIKFGSIYFSLTRLAQEGAVEIIEETREGNRPSKTVYGITEKGREEYMRLLKELWSGDSKTNYPFDIALFFVTSLSKEEVRLHLNRRISEMEQTLEYMKKHKEEHADNVNIPPQAAAIMDHSICHMNAEYKWLQGLLEKLDSFY
jgi:DNA-binding PadR family transcriptional regulator